MVFHDALHTLPPAEGERGNLGGLRRYCHQPPTILTGRSQHFTAQILQHFRGIHGQENGMLYIVNAQSHCQPMSRLEAIFLGVTEPPTRVQYAQWGNIGQPLRDGIQP